MTVLGIETATIVCSTAIAVDGGVVAEVRFERPRAHAEVLVSQVDEVLKKAALKIADVDGLAVSIGPGSFTGLRIGLSMAKGLAWSAGKPIAGISTLRALARKASASGQVSEGDLMLTVLDARKGELYCRLDRVALGKLTPEWKERSLGVERLLEELREISVTVTGETEQLREKAIKSGTLRFLQGEVNLCSAGPVALEGEEALTRGEVLDLRTLEPRYLKEFEPKLKPAGRI